MLLIVLKVSLSDEREKLDDVVLGGRGACVNTLTVVTQRVPAVQAEIPDICTHINLFLFNLTLFLQAYIGKTKPVDTVRALSMRVG